MDFLKDGILDWIAWVLRSMIGSIDGDAILKLARMNPNGLNGAEPWMQTAWTTSKAISSEITLVIGWSLLSLFLAISLIKIFEKQDLRDTIGLFNVFMAVFKIVLAKMVMDNIDLIIASIFEVATAAINTTTISSISYSAGGWDQTIQSVIDAAKTQTDNMNILGLLSGFLIGLILNLGSMIAGLLTKLVLYTRFIELYVFVAIAPIPIATFPSEEYSQAFKNWVKRIIAIALHAILIVICVSLYTAMMKTSMTTLAGKGDFIAAFTQIALFQLVLVIALFQTGGWAKSIATAS